MKLLTQEILLQIRFKRVFVIFKFWPAGGAFRVKGGCKIRILGNKFKVTTQSRGKVARRAIGKIPDGLA